MSDHSERFRLPLLQRIQVHLRMMRNAYRITARGLRHPVSPGDSINLVVKLRVHIDGEFHV